VTFTKKVGNIVHYKHMFVVINHTIDEAEENAQSNGKQGANHLDEVVILDK
jgi:hypothetical protein